MGFPAYFITKEHKFCAFNSRDIQKYRLRRAETLLFLLLPIKIKCQFLRLEKKYRRHIIVPSVKLLSVECRKSERPIIVTRDR